MTSVRKLLFFCSLAGVLSAGVRAAPTAYNSRSEVLQSANLSIKEFPTHGSPSWISAGPDGNLWFTEERANKIGRITRSGQVTEYAVPTQGGGPVGITAGPDGNLWFTEYKRSKIGRITPSGRVTEYAIPTQASGPWGITVVPGGNLWFVEANGNKIGRITRSGQVTEYAVPTHFSTPEGITAGPDGNLWFTEFGASKIGRITRSGQVTEYAVPTQASRPWSITAEPDGNLWFTEFSASKIGRVTRSGQVMDYAVPTQASEPWGITAGSDGNLWFTEFGASKIGRFTTPFPSPTSFLLTQSGSCLSIPSAGQPSTCAIIETVNNKGNHPLDFSHTVTNHLAIGVRATAASSTVGATRISGSTVAWRNFRLQPYASATAAIYVSFTPTAAQVGRHIVLSTGITASAADTVTGQAFIVSVGGVVTPTPTTRPTFTLESVRTQDAQGRPQGRFRPTEPVYVQVIWMVQDLRGQAPYTVRTAYQHPQGKGWSGSGLPSQLEKSGQANNGTNTFTFLFYAPKAFPAYRVVVRVRMFKRWSTPRAAVIYVHR